MVEREYPGTGGRPANGPISYPGPYQHEGSAGYPYAARQPPRPEAGLPRPVAVEAVPGTPFGVAVVGVQPTASGPAFASLVAGVAATLISLVVGCFGAIGAEEGWGPTVAGAFAVLAGFLGLAAVVLGRAGLRQIKRTAGWGTVTGRGVAVAGMICGAVGLAFTVMAIGFAFAAAAP